jgi:drug/metabolite transporter (DMT)-like permease
VTAETVPARRLAPTGLLLLAAVAFFWGISWVAIKAVVTEMPVLPFRTICCVAGGLGALAVARATGERLRLPRRELFPLALMGLLNVTGWQICMAFGLRILPAGHASIIAYTMPAFATLLGWLFLKERLTAVRLWALALSMAGLGVLIVPELAEFQSAPLGIALMVGASLNWAGGTVGMKYFRWSLSAMQNAGWQFLLGGIPIVIANAIEGSTPEFGSLSTAGWISFAYVLFVPILFCQWAWLKSIELLPGSLSAMGTLAIPVVGAFSGALLLHEKVESAELFALGLVTAALALMAFAPKSGNRAVLGPGRTNV